MRSILSKIYDSYLDIDFNSIHMTVGSLDISKDKDPAFEFDYLKDIDDSFINAGFKPPRRIPVDQSPEELIANIKKESPTLILNLNEFIQDVDVKQVSTCSIFDLLHIPYVGADAFSMSLSTDKFTSKAVMVGSNIKTPLSKEFKQGESVDASTMTFPLFVKPVNEDGSAGIDNNSIIYNLEDLVKRVKYIHDTIHDTALVEEFIDGREFAVFIYGNNSPTALPVCELDMSKIPTSGPRFMTNKVKNIDHSNGNKTVSYISPADISDAHRVSMIDSSLRAYRAFRCRDYARFDFRMCKGEGNIFMMEINNNPDLSNEYVFGSMRKAANLSLWDFLKIVLTEAYSRKYT